MKQDNDLSERIYQSESTSGRTYTENAEITLFDDIPKPVKKAKGTKISKHGADMLTGLPRKKQEEMLSRIILPDDNPRTTKERIQIFSQLVARSIGLTQFENKEDCPDRIGFNLTNQVQMNVLFAILKRMTENNYKGEKKIPNSIGVKNAYTGERNNPNKIEDALSKGFETPIVKNQIGGALKNISETPVWRFTQKEIVSLSGYNPEKGSEVQRVAEELVNLSYKQNFLMWTRYKRDGRGKIMINPKTKKREMELVSTFSPVLWVKNIQDPETKKFLYYEIAPAPIFLDEVSAEYGGGKNGYFVLIPEEADKEISSTYKRLFPYRTRVSLNIQTFCFWLRIRVQELQGKVNNPFSRSELNPVIRISYFDLCREILISESTIKTQKKNTRNQISDGIRTAKEIGYITDGYLDEKTEEYILTLNFDFYPPFKKKEPELELFPEDETTEKYTLLE